MKISIEKVLRLKRTAGNRFSGGGNDYRRRRCRDAMLRVFALCGISAGYGVYACSRIIKGISRHLQGRSLASNRAKAGVFAQRGLPSLSNAMPGICSPSHGDAMHHVSTSEILFPYRFIFK
jgi:hypothetical protein